jgi:hypothetical protein
MTETDWLNGPDPIPMLAFLRGKASHRKLRLFACACCRRIWHRLTDERSRKGVEVAERYADGLITHADLKQAWVESSAALQGPIVTHSGQSVAAVAARNAVDPLRSSIAEAVLSAARAGVLTQNALDAGKAAQASLLRDLLANPFRPISTDPSWLLWNDHTVKKIAQAIYDDRAFDRMPILADALEEAGCTEQSILDHCRSGGEHVRGCWVMDLLLGKE